MKANILSLFAFLLLLSCTTDDVSLSSAANDLGENGDGKLEMVPVRFFGYNIAVDVEEQSARGWKSQLTRAGSDKTAFIENDEIGLFVTNTNTVPDGTLSTSVSAAYNNHYQFNNSNELISIDGNIVYQYKKPTTRQSYRYTAVYPYISGLQADGGTFYVKADQSSQSDFYFSDFAIADSINDSTIVNLKFYHKMSEIIIIFNRGTGTSLLTELKTTLKNIHRGVSINLNSADQVRAITTDEADSVVCYNEDFYYADRRICRVIIPAQTLSSSVPLGVVKKGDKNYTLKLKNSITLQQGHRYICQATFSNDGAIVGGDQQDPNISDTRSCILRFEEE